MMEQEKRLGFFFKNVPTDSLLFWLQADVNITQAGGYVSVWDDINGNGKKATQTTASQQPAISKDALSRSKITFDGVDDQMTINFSAASLSALSIVIVAKFVSYVHTNGYFFNNVSSGQNGFDFGYNGGSLIAFIKDSASRKTFNTSISRSTNLIMPILTFGGGSANLYVNNALAASNNSMAATLNATFSNMLIGADTNTLIYDVIAYNKVLTAGERDLLYSYYQRYL